MKIEFKTGNFTLNVEGDVNAETRDRLLANGVKYELQRDVASKVYLSLAGVKGKKDGLVLPEKFERDSIAYSDETADSFAKAATAELSKRGNFVVEVSENVGGESASPMKRATAFVDTLVAAGQTAQLVAVLGVAPDADRDALIEAAHKMGLGIQPPKGK